MSKFSKDFECAFERFLQEQIRGAAGMRLELLGRDLTGTKKLCEILYRVFGTLDDCVLEYEYLSEAGIKIYADVYHRKLHIVFETHGYVVHVEKLTREKHSFEQMRIRSFMNAGMKYIPFSWDELDKRSEICLRSVYEVLGRFGKAGSAGWMSLPVNEREIIRCAMIYSGLFGMDEACEWLKLGAVASRRVLQDLIDKGLLIQVGGGSKRAFKFQINAEAVHKL